MRQRVMVGAAIWAVLAVAAVSGQVVIHGQLQLLKAEIAADPELSAQPFTTDGHTAIASALNRPAAPEYWVWRESVDREDILFTRGPEGTVFQWNDNGFILRSPSDILAWQELFWIGTIDMTLPTVRGALAEIFRGSGNAANNRAHIFAVGRRKATRGERVLASGTGTTASPAVALYRQPIQAIDVERARLIPDTAK